MTSLVTSLSVAIRKSLGGVVDTALDRSVVLGYTKLGSGVRRLRTDLSFTIFLSDPSTYDGGELAVDTPSGEHIVKPDAGDLVLYPSTTLHEVRPVTSGERVVCVGWIESAVRDAAAREILFDLENLRATLVQQHDAQSPEMLTLAKAISNLLRLWGDA